MDQSPPSSLSSASSHSDVTTSINIMEEQQQREKQSQHQDTYSHRMNTVQPTAANGQLLQSAPPTTITTTTTATTNPFEQDIIDTPAFAQALKDTRRRQNEPEQYHQEQQPNFPSSLNTLAPVASSSKKKGGKQQQIPTTLTATATSSKNNNFFRTSNVFARQHQQIPLARQDLTRPTFSCLIGHPRKVNDHPQSVLAKSYTAYPINTSWTTHHPHKDLTRVPANAAVLRRYSDFVWLRKELLERFSGFFVPPLPPKNTFSRFDAAVIERRRRLLQEFLTRIAKRPQMSTSQTLRTFLTADSDSFAIHMKESKAAQKRAGIVADDTSSSQSTSLVNADSSITDDGSAATAAGASGRARNVSIATQMKQKMGWKRFGTKWFGGGAGSAEDLTPPPDLETAAAAAGDTPPWDAAASSGSTGSSDVHTRIDAHAQRCADLMEETMELEQLLAPLVTHVQDLAAYYAQSAEAWKLLCNLVGTDVSRRRRSTNTVTPLPASSSTPAPAVEDDDDDERRAAVAAAAHAARERFGMGWLRGRATSASQDGAREHSPSNLSPGLVQAVLPSALQVMLQHAGPNMANALVDEAEWVTKHLWHPLAYWSSASSAFADLIKLRKSLQITYKTAIVVLEEQRAKLASSKNEQESQRREKRVRDATTDVKRTSNEFLRLGQVLVDESTYVSSSRRNDLRRLVASLATHQVERQRRLKDAWVDLQRHLGGV